ncbi:hypothetical protein B0H34DRAFT_470820 [Crassisporium funariophilum]|nr:hypothetical protein B0H34DRAFT_470820 [Crassisporium funariophilum]
MWLIMASFHTTLTWISTACHAARRGLAQASKTFVHVIKQGLASITVLTHGVETIARPVKHGLNVLAKVVEPETPPELPVTSPCPSSSDWFQCSGDDQAGFGVREIWQLYGRPRALRIARNKQLANFDRAADALRLVASDPFKHIVTSPVPADDIRSCERTSPGLIDSLSVSPTLSLLSPKTPAITKTLPELDPEVKLHNDDNASETKVIGLGILSNVEDANDFEGVQSVFPITTNTSVIPSTTPGTAPTDHYDLIDIEPDILFQPHDLKKRKRNYNLRASVCLSIASSILIPDKEVIEDLAVETNMCTRSSKRKGILFENRLCTARIPDVINSLHEPSHCADGPESIPSMCLDPVVPTSPEEFCTESFAARVSAHSSSWFTYGFDEDLPVLVDSDSCYSVDDDDKDGGYAPSNRHLSLTRNSTCLREVFDSNKNTFVSESTINTSSLCQDITSGFDSPHDDVYSHIQDDKVVADSQLPLGAHNFFSEDRFYADDDSIFAQSSSGSSVNDSVSPSISTFSVSESTSSTPITINNDSMKTTRCVTTSTSSSSISEIRVKCTRSIFKASVVELNPDRNPIALVELSDFISPGDTENLLDITYPLALQASSPGDAVIDFSDDFPQDSNDIDALVDISDVLQTENHPKDTVPGADHILSSISRNVGFLSTPLSYLRPSYTSTASLAQKRQGAILASVNHPKRGSGLRGFLLPNLIAEREAPLGVQTAASSIPTFVSPPSVLSGSSSFSRGHSIAPTSRLGLPVTPMRGIDYELGVDGRPLYSRWSLDSEDPQFTWGVAL